MREPGLLSIDASGKIVLAEIPDPSRAILEKFPAVGTEFNTAFAGPNISAAGAANAPGKQTGPPRALLFYFVLRAYLQRVVQCAWPIPCRIFLFFFLFYRGAVAFAGCTRPECFGGSALCLYAGFGRRWGGGDFF